MSEKGRKGSQLVEVNGEKEGGWKQEEEEEDKKGHGQAETSGRRKVKNRYINRDSAGMQSRGAW